MPYDDDYDDNHIADSAPSMEMVETSQTFPRHHMPYDDEYDDEGASDSGDSS